jgi:hypothetical protein
MSSLTSSSPESHARGHEREASYGFLAGFALMMALDNAFG